jgi:voltage-gated sodium channel
VLEPQGEGAGIRAGTWAILAVMRGVLERLVAERLVFALIVANTLLIFLRGFDAVDRAAPWLFWLDYGLTCYFMFELLVKLGLRGGAQFWSVSWNRLDFFVVLASTPMLLSPWMDWRDFGVLLVVRCARLLRLLRGFRVIPDSERLWTGVRRALRASVGVFMVMFIYNLILGLGASTLFAEAAPKYFENPALAMYSMFKIFTVEGWYEIPDYIAAQSSVGLALFARLYFTFAVITGGIPGLSLANAVFVDEMVIDNTNLVEDHVDALTEKVQQNQVKTQTAIAELTDQVEQLRAESRRQA